MSSKSNSNGGSDDEERFLLQLKDADPRRYTYQLEIYQKLHPGHPCPLKLMPYFKQFGKPGVPIIQGMDLGEVKHYSYSELEEITSINKFVGRDSICRITHGRLLHGRIKMDSSSLEDVIVKTWDFTMPLRNGIFYPARIHDELIFLQDPDIKSHPNVVKLIGYHCEKTLAVIYKAKRPAHILKDILKSDYFEWEDRLKVAIEIGSVLKMFHDKGIVYGGDLSRSTMLDEKFSPTIFGFQAYDVNKTFYQDPIGGGPRPPDWSMKDDVFMYGILLVELVSKGRHGGGIMFQVEEWWMNPPHSIVHEHFSENQSVASKIIELAFSCVEAYTDERPSIGAAVAALQNFAAIKKQKLCE